MLCSSTDMWKMVAMFGHVILGKCIRQQTTQLLIKWAVS